MSEPAIEDLFRAFRRSHSPQALAGVFDRTAPELGRIASYLAGGDARLAEDLLQSTWLTAMAHASRWDESRPLLPWLLGVLGNHARSHRRSARRSASNAADALGELLATDDPQRASEDAEFQRLLAQALAAMEPPFREAVTLHVQHGLTAKEIGEALGRPAGTVRTQIVRGLDRLRELLPRGLALCGLGVLALGSDAIARVRADVLARLPKAPVPAPAAWRWVLAIVAAAAAIALAPQLLQTANAPARATAGAAAMDVVAAPPAGVREPERDLVAAAQDPAPVPVAKPRRRITAHVWHADEPAVQAGELVGLIEDDDVRFVATDASGTAVFDDVARVEVHQLFVSGTQVHESVFQEWRDSFDVAVTLHVSDGQPLAVNVVDAGGKPVAGAEVEGNGSQFARRRWCTLGWTDERGELRLRGQWEHPAQLRARANGHAPSPWQQAVAEGGAQRCELRLGAPVATLRGRVVDDAGKPVAADLGTIACGGGSDSLEEPWYDHTAADGTFAFEWLPAGHVAIVARVRSGDRVRRGLLRLDVPVTGEVELRLARGATLCGTVRTSSGEGAGGEIFRGRLLADAIFELPFCTFDDRIGNGGVVRCEGLLPGRWRFQAEVGSSTAETVIDLRDGEEARWDPVAPVLRELRVRLRDERGALLANWRVQPFDAEGHPLGSSWPTNDDGITFEQEQWRVSPDEPLVLEVYDSIGFEHCLGFPTFVVPGVVPTGGIVDVVVPDSRRCNRHVRGRVVDADGQPVAADVFVTSSRNGWSTLRTDGKDGAFAIGPLPPGRVHLRIEAKGQPELDFGGVDVPPGADVDLGAIQLLRPACVRARAAESSAPPDLSLQLVPEKGDRRLALERRDGEWRNDEVPPGRYLLRGSSGTHQVVAQAIVVAASDVDVVFRWERAPTLRVAVELVQDVERASPSWSGTLTVKDGSGTTVVRRTLRRRFAGHFEPVLTFDVALPPGRYDVELETWTRRTARTACDVTATGGAVTLKP